MIAAVRTRGILSVVACAAVLAGPAPLAARQTPWKFVAFGDAISFNFGEQVNTNILGELALAVVAENPDFLLFLGDFSLSGTEQGLALWTNTMAPVWQAGIPIYPAIGNHDVYALPAISNLFCSIVPSNGPPGEVQTTYALAYKNALFLVLNEFAPPNYYGLNLPWVNAVLATNTQPHVFAAGHVPAFKVHHLECLEYSRTNRDAFWNALGNAGGRIYFSGHDHFYDHSRLDDGDGIPANDLHQIIVGTGGAPLYPGDAYDGNNGRWLPVRLYYEQQHGYLTVEVNGDTVTTVWHPRTGANTFGASDVFSYSIARPVLHHSYSDGCLTLSWEGPAHLEVAPEPVGPFIKVWSAGSPFVVSNPPAPRLFFRLISP